MTTPIEQAAKAAYDSTKQPWDPSYDEQGESIHLACLVVARAVLFAIREPSEGMVDAMYAAGVEHGLDYVFRSAINAALAEGP